MNQRLQNLRKSRMQALASGNAQKDFRAQTDDTGTSHMYIYDIIDDWMGVGASDVIQALLSFGDSDVVVHINSPGGSVTEGLAIYNTLKNHTPHVQVRVEGVAASAASFIMLAGDEVIIEPNAMVMIHDVWDLTVGNEADHRKAADLLGKASINLSNIYAAKAGGTPDDWRAKMKTETWYIGQEAVDAGLVNSVGNAVSDTQNVWEGLLSGARAEISYPQNKAPITPEYDRSSFLAALKGI